MQRFPTFHNINCDNNPPSILISVRGIPVSLCDVPSSLCVILNGHTIRTELPSHETRQVAVVGGRNDFIGVKSIWWCRWYLSSHLSPFCQKQIHPSSECPKKHLQSYCYCVIFRSISIPPIILTAISVILGWCRVNRLTWRKRIVWMRLTSTACGDDQFLRWFGEQNDTFCRYQWRIVAARGAKVHCNFSRLRKNIVTVFFKDINPNLLV